MLSSLSLSLSLLTFGLRWRTGFCSESSDPTKKIFEAIDYQLADFPGQQTGPEKDFSASSSFLFFIFLKTLFSTKE